MTNPDISVTVCSPKAGVHIFHFSAAIVFGAVYLRWSIKAMLNSHASAFFLSSTSWSFGVFVVGQFVQANKENTSDRMDKSTNLNPVGNIESFGSSINSTLSVEIVEGSKKLFAFVKS